MIYKGVHSGIESYSSFYDNNKMKETKLKGELDKRGITVAFVCGLATDVCVGELLTNFSRHFLLHHAGYFCI